MQTFPGTVIAAPPQQSLLSSCARSTIRASVCAIPATKHSSIMNTTAILLVAAGAWYSLPAPLGAQTEPINVAGLLASAQANLAYSTVDIGPIGNIFDGYTSSLARTPAINPMVVTLSFSNPQELMRSRVWFLAGDNKWRLETANTVADLDAASGSYRVAFDWQTGSEATWRDRTLTTPITCQAIRLKLQRLTGDNYVHLNEWQLFLFDRPEPFAITSLRRNGTDLELEWNSARNRTYQLQYSDTMATGTWQDLGVMRSGDGTTLPMSTPYDPGTLRRFYRMALVDVPAAPEGFVVIQAGSFAMGNALSASGDGNDNELPVHPVAVSAFHMAKHEVTKGLWDDVRGWGTNNGYTDLPTGFGKLSTHPVRRINWWAMLKWCNARSQMDNLTPCYYTDSAQTLIFKTGTNDSIGIDNTMVKWTANGYRLPTEAEWEKAARGGLNGKRFPWGDTINHSYANYYNGSYFYESPQNQGYHPSYYDGTTPYTSPVGAGATFFL